jgi:hypothetical protein
VATRTTTFLLPVRDSSCWLRIISRPPPFSDRFQCFPLQTRRATLARALPSRC